MGSNQLLSIRTSKGVRPLNIKDMSNIFNTTDRQTINFLRKMIELHVLKEVRFGDERWYAVNPLYGFRYKYLSYTAFVFFQEELKNEISPTALNELKSEALKSE